MIDKSDLAEFNSTLLTGVTVGIGSQVLIFANGANIIIQCPFVCGDESIFKRGHGENPASALILFELLNSRVHEILLGEDGVLLLNFEGVKSLKIIPENNGFESYVVSTQLGVFPAIY